MKTENFDKLFRQKLLDLAPGASADEAVALYQRIAAGRKRTQRKRGMLLLFILLFISLLALNIGQWLSIRSLEEKNEQLAGHIRSINSSLKQIGQQHSALALNVSNETSGHHPANSDTIKREDRSENSSSNEAISQNAFTQDKHQNTATGKAGYSATGKTDHASGKNIRGENTNYNNTTGEMTASTQQSAMEPEKNKADHLPDSSATPVFAKDTGNSKDSIISVAQKTTSSSIAADNSLAEDETADLPADTKERRFKLSGRAGLNMQKANSQIGGGITGDLFVGRHWGFNIGLNYVAIDNDNFSDEDDFRRRKGHDFRDYTLPNLSDTVKATNIDIDYTLLQIPIAINYRFGLPRNFFLLASLGTDLDVYGRKKIAYFTHSGPYNEELNNQNSTNKVIALNNTVIGLAAEKQWNRLTLQVGSFLSPQLKKTDYKSNTLYYGLRLRCFYNFGM